MNIYLLRHTSLCVKENTFYGQTDLDVSNNFLGELSIIKKKLLKFNIMKNKPIVFSSPLIRCKKLSEKLFVNFEIDHRLKELDFGDWEMKHISSIDKSEIKSWESDIINFQIPNGESNIMFFNRLKSFCDEKIKLKKNIFIVAHAGSINCIISYLTKIPFDQLVKDNWKRISYGSLSILSKKTNKFSIDFLGV